MIYMGNVLAGCETYRRNVFGVRGRYNENKVTGKSFHAHYLVQKAFVQNVVAFKTSSDISVIEMSLTR